ncbi:MAG: dihydroorotase [Bifidobacterium sp.]|uniref:Dihydroorotase n=2 Tax=Bifidobacterium TaxID=1678 RepID=A0AB39UPE3_9BIFI
MAAASMQPPDASRHAARGLFRVVFHGLRVWNSGEIIDVALPPAALNDAIDDGGLFSNLQTPATQGGGSARTALSQQPVLPNGSVCERSIHIDADGLTIAPGLCDPHVHFRDPGQRDKEDMLSGCRAAAAGGFTTVLLMPNTAPAMDGRHVDVASAGSDDADGIQDMRESGHDSVIDYLQHYAQSHGVVLPAKFLLSVCASVGRSGLKASDPQDWMRYLRSEIALDPSDAAMAEHPLVAISDDGSAVTSRTLAEVGANARRFSLPILDHCEHHETGVMNDGVTSRHLGLPGIPAATELAIVARDIEFARQTGTHMHLQHVSTALAFDAIRKAKGEGLPVTCETAPHYLALCDEDVQRFQTLAKMNPPLRSAADRDATIAAVADGTVDMLATDHAPHTMHEKMQGMVKSPNGIIGLETAYGVCHRVLVDSGAIDDERLIELMSVAPARLMGFEAPDIPRLLDTQAATAEDSDNVEAESQGNGSDRGAPERRILDLSGLNRSAVNSSAFDYTILDTRGTWTVKSANFHSKARNTPFEGMKVSGRAQATILDGRIAFSRIPASRLTEVSRLTGEDKLR